MLAATTPDLATLDLLASVADLGSLGRAATAHRISQPAVSMRMRDLERRLGLRLLERDARGTRLTPAGVEVDGAGRRVLAAVADLLAVVDSLHSQADSHLRVASSLTVSEHLLPAWIAVVHRDFPDVSLSMEVTNSQRVLETIASGRADLGFVEGTDRELPGMHTVAVRADRLVVVVAPSHPWARGGPPVDGATLAATDLIVREPGSGTREVLDAALAPWGGVRSRLEFGSSVAVLAAARRGDGPAALSALAVAGDVDAGRLVPVALTGVELTRSFRAVWPAGRPLPVLARRLLDAAGR